jgi:GPI mannosyltransferase 3
MNRALFRQPRIVILLLILLAVVSRVAALFPDSLHHPDEIGQYLEQAHRLVFGYGTVTWEYRLGMRNWLLPLLYSAPMALGSAIAPESELYLQLPRYLSASASLGLLWGAYRMGKQQSQAHALIALVVAVTWFEFVMFAAHTLSEPLATAAILCAVALLYDQSAQRRALIIAGFLLGMGILLRFHYALPAGIIALGLCWKSWKERLVPVILGGCGALVLGAITDLAMGMTPYAWVFTNIYQNVVLNRSANFGVAGPEEYLIFLGIHWGPVAFIILPLIMVGYARHRIVIWAAIANLALHSAIGHKEYRFIFLSVAIFIIVAALSSVDVLKWLSARRSVSATPGRLIALAALWAGLSAAQAQAPAIKSRWTAFSEFKQAMSLAKADPKVCGIAVQAKMYWLLGSYAKLHRNLPIYIRNPLDPNGTGQSVKVQNEPAYNSVIGPETLSRELTKDYQSLRCLPVDQDNVQTFYPPGATKVCLFQRPGGCNAKRAKGKEINRWLTDTGR